ncbi:hypothetical protein N781_12545 [Pontibacillus halophilus JSM 076056 = DSM 19796]|uniref:Uncharacterized protein n=1 Tax=Pontibacillus halophilus JSM 076056 = DSM 19796 TaxID=1385510 RepID=A0A0A5GJ98_9BACI|nr:hypothetical protein [Pontibacillus halophilus]KGX93331.1 hypothetical protein N781_12545 [Pontibacillus halophilus JSM 076056 = DSM 19796]
MSFKRQSIILAGNAVLGLLTCYLYLYFWLLFSFGESFLNVKAASSLIIAVVVMVAFNFVAIPKQSRYWIQAIATFIGTIIVFILFFQL